MSRSISYNVKFDVVYFTAANNISETSGTIEITELSAKVSKITITDDVVIVLPELSNETLSFMLKVTQGAGGGHNIALQYGESIPAINLSEFVFTDGTEGQRTWVTLLWDGEEWCFTASAWKDAVNLQ